MIEDELRDGMRAAVTSEPPLGFSTAELIDTARDNARRKRTALAATGAAVFVALGTVGAVAATGGGGATQLPATSPGQPDVRTIGADSPTMRVGLALAESLPEVEPAAHDFTVLVPASPVTGEALNYGHVQYQDDEGPTTLFFVAFEPHPAVSPGDICDAQACSWRGDVLISHDDDGRSQDAHLWLPEITASLMTFRSIADAERISDQDLAGPSDEDRRRESFPLDGRQLHDLITNREVSKRFSAAGKHERAEEKSAELKQKMKELERELERESGGN